MRMGREETKEKKKKPLGLFLFLFFGVSLSSTNERIHYEEENHNNLHKGAEAALDPTKQFWFSYFDSMVVVIANWEYFLLENIC